MPYIRKERRHEFGWHYCFPTDCGELNYILTVIAKEYIDRKGESYQTYNDIIGALECCKQELYRRKIAPYEDKKIKENGDVY